MRSSDGGYFRAGKRRASEYTGDSRFSELGVENAGLTLAGKELKRYKNLITFRN